MVGLLRAQVIIMAGVAGQPELPKRYLQPQQWGDVTGASSSQGNVIKCTWGVLCKGGFVHQDPPELCEGDFECVPDKVPAGSPVPLQPLPLEPGPVVPAPAEGPSKKSLSGDASISSMGNMSTRNDTKSSVPQPVAQLRGTHSLGAQSGPKRLSSRAKGHEISCHCGVACHLGHNGRGEEMICKGPLVCNSCMPMQMGGAAVDMLDVLHVDPGST
ncbi:unnamed protein product [Durusdinium trenchii]|uniref:Uncharacterized protein n=1 Tax=Durusdinium trenchii TaxID=1381693 RepID=A0ABP0KXI2_9DINO